MLASTFVVSIQSLLASAQSQPRAERSVSIAVKSMRFLTNCLALGLTMQGRTTTWRSVHNSTNCWDEMARLTLKGLHQVRKVNADGSQTWHIYAWRGGPKIASAPQRMFVADDALIAA